MLRPVNWYSCQKEKSLTLKQRDLLPNSKLISSSRSKLNRKKKEKVKLKVSRRLVTIGRQLLKIFVQLLKLSKKTMLINNRKMKKETWTKRKK
jgi:hypothetical protein